MTPIPCMYNVGSNAPNAGMRKRGVSRACRRRADVIVLGHSRLRRQACLSPHSPASQNRLVARSPSVHGAPSCSGPGLAIEAKTPSARSRGQDSLGSVPAYYGTTGAPSQVIRSDRNNRDAARVRDHALIIHGLCSAECGHKTMCAPIATWTQMPRSSRASPLAVKADPVTASRRDECSLLTAFVRRRLSPQGFSILAGLTVRLGTDG